MTAAQPPDDPGLEAAYGATSPEDNRRLYAAWAASYDDGFAARTGYRLPVLVAARFAALGGAGPVLDAGAGTGLVGAALAQAGVGPVDGIDLSEEMLAAAAAKGVYRHLVRADLTRALPPLPAPYRGLVSSGTFTHGHLGPEALAPLVALMAPGGLAVLSVNLGVWDRGFAAALAALPVTDPGREDLPIYDRPDRGHEADRAAHVWFRRA